MTENQNTVLSHVIMQVKPGAIVDEKTISDYVSLFKKLNPLTPDEEQEVVRELHSRLSVRMDRGASIKEKDHVTWYYSAKKDISPVFWDRYRLYLMKHQGFNQDVINSLDIQTDEMMDYLGNPNQAMDYSRSGLVIGDVQSGKTSTYTALINKAADAGYKIVILLTGTIEKLRRQTQGRLDEGFVGLDSTAFIRDKDNVLVGVGNINASISGWAVTSTSSDFNTNAAKQFNGKLSSISSPVLFVLKKHKSVLENLEQWLRVYNANPADKKIHIPMLLIDDEADNASVNTKKKDDSPTAINAGIRKILRLFTRSNYVAFTATPYANIFINPDTKDEMLGDELFPRDFIYALDASSTYIGARDIFPENGKHHYMLKTIYDCEPIIPLKHKKEFVPTGLPETMVEAIASFFIANAIRDLRGHTTSHRSMLINVSRFIGVQDKLSKYIDAYVRELQREIKNYCKTGQRALDHESIAYIKDVYDRHYATLSEKVLDGEKRFTWEQIQYALSEAVAPIVVRSVNGGNASKNLNYDECEDGLRIIAVGGFSLSRGLTLEGLCISYYYRNSKMYDTLMQMGRWFGYREHYKDLCQIWMSDTSADWYEYISEASDELRLEVKKMDNMGLTPRHFGLGVRSDKDALLVTAVNKMRYTEEIPMIVSLDGRVVETPYIHSGKEANSQNYNLVTEWVAELLKAGYHYADGDNLSISHPQILGIPKEYIMDLLANYKSHYLNMDFRTSDLANLIQNTQDHTLDEWDVMIACGSCEEISFCQTTVRPILRAFAVKKDTKALQMSGKGARLGSASHGKGGLTKEMAAKIETVQREAASNSVTVKKAFSQEDYFKSGLFRRPLLTIYPVQLSPKTKRKGGIAEIDQGKQAIVDEYDSVLIGLSIGIPRIGGKQPITYQYRINTIKWRELFDVDENDYYEETGIEED